MKKIILAYFMLISLPQFCLATPDSLKFIVVRLDYLSFQPKHLYYFQQQYNPSNPAEHEKVYHDLYVKIIPAGDFGGTRIRNATTGEIVYEATTIWDGTGQHIFPTSNFEIDTVNNVIKPNLVFFDMESHFFNQNDSASADSAWRIASKVIPLNEFKADKYNAFLYLHYFRIGASDPSTAEWIIIYYSILENGSGKWTNISGDLPNLHINSIAPHPFYTDSLFIGTNAGAFQTSDGGNHWNKIKFGENPDVRITQIRAEMHPILDWTVPVLWLGTEEFSMIPEDRLGRIFFSADGGSKWIDTYFPRIAVSALDVPTDSSLVAFAAAYNPFYYLDSFFAMDDTGWVEYDLTPGDTTVIHINCIEVDEKNHNQWFLATSNGLYITTDWGINWTNNSANWNSPWVVIPPHQPGTLYAILLGGSRSEGIYLSKDAGQNWERACWTVNTVTFLPDLSTPRIWYQAIRNIGVYKSVDDCSTWTDISRSLPEKDILCLVQDRRNPRVLYAGTTNGIFRYEESATNIWQDRNIQKQNIPRTFKVYSAYPNPFNSTTVIRLKLFESNRVSLKIYNVLGQLIRTLIDEKKEAGMHIISWDGTDNVGRPVSTGIYMCGLVIDHKGEVDIQKLILIK